jgi:hypothetical protein
LFARLNGFPRVTILPIYANPSFGPALTKPPPGPSSTGSSLPPHVQEQRSAHEFGSVISCANLAVEPVLGTCPTGARAVAAQGDVLLSDNPLETYKNLPIVTASSPRVSSPASRLPLMMLLVRTNDPATLERVRTFLSGFDATLPPAGAVPLEIWSSGDAEPVTFGEVATTRNNDVNNLERFVLVVLGLTLLVAGCSLAVTVGGSLVERKRPFTLLRVTGTPSGVLRRVVLLEAVVPLLAASLVVALTGGLIAVPVVRALLPKTAHVAYPGPLYYLTMGLGFMFAIAVISATLPLLNRITRTENARFE